MDKGDDIVECPICTGRYYQQKPGHFKRHMKSIHNIEVPTKRSGRRAQSVESTDNETNRHSSFMKQVSNIDHELKSCKTDFVPMIVQEILQRPSGYNLKDLMEFVSKKYKNIPDQSISILVRTAVETAWWVAKAHHEIICFQQSSDMGDKLKCELAKRKMMMWIAGLKLESKFEIAEAITNQTEVGEVCKNQVHELGESVIPYTPSKPMTNDTKIMNEMLYSPTLPVLEGNSVKEYLKDIQNTVFPVEKGISDASFQHDTSNQWALLSLEKQPPVYETRQEFRQAIREVCGMPESIASINKSQTKLSQAKVNKEESEKSKLVNDPLVKRSYAKSKVVATKPKGDKAGAAPLSDKEKIDSDIKTIKLTTEESLSKKLSDPRINRENNDSMKKPVFSPVIVESVKLNKTRVSKVNNENNEQSKEKKKQNTTANVKPKAEQADTVKKPKIVFTRLSVEKQDAQDTKTDRHAKNKKSDIYSDVDS